MSAPALPAAITTQRLALPLWDAATVTALREGGRLDHWHPEFPRREDVDAAGLWREGDPWGPRSVVSLRTGAVMGSVGFFGPPEPAADDVPEVEVGFGLVPTARGHGAMTEALAALLPLADAAGVRVPARVRPENRVALRLLTVRGFTDVRASGDDDTLVLVRPRG
ncbi:GNAT family N-acetyltransferase [Nocardioides panacisoli]|uniref:GNAT family N-acetyltransferase n=1 Tax=Nocardioides panacisoli TaxID=627624 RepID=UPI001C63684A|nr:GNAT family protein [Nocardioides panacisoli]QYJ02866.1 GNAT family N-acetyltransferase [Nocardioides panacisoli]